MQRRALTWTLARIALAVLLVGLILAFLDLNFLFQEASRLSWRALVWATLFNILTVVVLTLRWFVAVRRYVPGPFLWHARHYWTSILFNLFTPAALGSDVYRIVFGRNMWQRPFDEALGIVGRVHELMKGFGA